MIDLLLNILLVLGIAVAIAIVLRWGLPQLGLPPPIVSAVLLVLAIVVLVVIARMLLGTGWAPARVGAWQMDGFGAG